MTDVDFPAGHHYAVTWGIPDNYAGMTNSLLHRSRAFVRLGLGEVTILTYDHRPDYDAVRRRLRERGATIEGMHVRNLWEDLRGWNDAQLADAVSTAEQGVHPTFAPLGAQADQKQLSRTVRDDAGDLLQIDYLRKDGTLLCSDRRNVPGEEPRSVTLCDTSGQPLGTWLSIWDLYYAWLDTLPRDPVAWMIVDSKTTANHLCHYRRDDVVTMHVVHGSHLGTDPVTHEVILRSSREYVMERLDDWDLVAFLTRQQLDEVDAMLGPGANRRVIPHGRDVPERLPTVKRSRFRGVMLTSLDKRKQIAHAIKAMNRVGRIRLRRVTLDVWGRGPYEERLQKYIESTNAPVQLRGYSNHASEEFAKASFSLLTSHNEAFGLVVVESMAQGCIPISYDLAYGPGDIITHGVDGFLVPPDDIWGLVTEIRRLVRAKPADLEPIRAAAHRRALEFNDQHVTEQWVSAMEDALASKRS